MLKYLKYFLPSITGVLAIITFLKGEYYPTLFLICFSLFLILGDVILPKDKGIQKFSYPVLLNLSIYINLPIIFIFILLIISFFSTDLAPWYLDIIYSYFNFDLIQLQKSINIFDKISLIILSGLNIGILGTVPGHELTHRKRNKFDMFVGNWLLAFSWDCAFAIEHVYAHHKNVCLPEDPATAKRGENIYLFIFKAIAKEQVSAWKIELNRLKRKSTNYFSLHNRMIVGYLRSLSVTVVAFVIGGTSGMLCFLFCALLGKSLLEAINYTEHYGLVRERSKPVCMRHSWNSNHCLSSLYLFNVTRHSDHHRTSNLKFWELDPRPSSAPILPYGYLGMLYLSLVAPFLYHKIMAKKLIQWDRNFANENEKDLADIQNKNSGIPILGAS